MLKMKFLSTVLVTLLFLANTSLFAEDLPPPPNQLPNLSNKIEISKPTIIPTPPKVEADSYILIDADSGKVLAEQNSTLKRAPASLTKMMTMYVVSQAIRDGKVHMDDQIYVSKNAWQTGGSRMFIKAGQKVPVRDLIQGIIVVSGNDACVAMAEHLAGSEESFANLMNQVANQLGMKDSNFTDSTGMPNPDHYTTARDMAILARGIIKNFPEDYHWYKQQWFEFNGIKQPNRNHLLWRDSSVDGIKTGHTNDAGYCLVTSAKRNDMRLVAVVMGAPSTRARTDDNQRLLNFGFRFFETHQLYKANQTIEKARVWLGKDKELAVGIPQDIAVTIPQGQYPNLKASLELAKFIKAPIKKGQSLGNVNVVFNGQTIVSQPLVALADNPEGGLWTRLNDSIHLKLARWLHSTDNEHTDAKPTK